MKQALSSAAFFRRDTAAQPGAGPAGFTPRQLEVLALLCEGLPNKLICRRLNIAAGTVKVHIGCILRELKVASRLQAVVVARSRGLCTGLAPEDDVSDIPAASEPALAARSREGVGASLASLGI